MLKTWDFIDPKLANRLKQTQKQLNQLKQKRKQIQQNTKISSVARQKLLSYNDECIKDLMQILNKNKQTMIDYFDVQVNVLTKKQIQQHRGYQDEDKEGDKQVGVGIGQCLKSIRSMSINKTNQQITKLTFDQDKSWTQSNTHTHAYSHTHSHSHTHTHNSQSLSINRKNNNMYININTNTNSSDSQCKYYKNDNNLDTTGRFTSKNALRDRQVRSFQLAATNRNYSISMSMSMDDQEVDNGIKTIKNTGNMGNMGNRGNIRDYGNQKQERTQRKPKACISKIYKRKIQRKLAKKQFKYQMERIIHQDMQYQIDKLKEQSKQDKFLIELLYQKIDLLEKNQIKRINQEKNKIQHKYQKQLESLRNKYLLLSQVQQQNKQLMMTRKQLLKVTQK